MRDVGAGGSASVCVRERVDSTGDSPPTKNTTSDVIRRLFPREILRKGYNVHTAQSVTQASNSKNIKIIKTLQKT